jgi:hypothetical protein
VKAFLQLPFIKSIRERQLLLPIVVGIAVVAVLLHGALRHERAAEASDSSFLQLPTPPSLPDLRPRLEKTPLTYLSDYYLQLAEQAKNKFVLIGQEKQPGLVVTPGVILTSIRVADDSIRPQSRRPMRDDESSHVSRNTPEPSPAAEEEYALVADVSALESQESSRPLPLTAVDPELGIALFAMEQPYIASPFAIVDPSVMPAGSRVLAVTLLAGGALEITPGYLASPGAAGSSESPEPLHVSVVFSEPPAAAAIVDLDGRFLGAAVESDGGVRLLSSNTILQVVDRLREGTPCRAIQVSDLSEAVRDVLELNNGILVEKVLDQAFLPQPSIRPGDILLQWDGEVISKAEQFYSLYDKNPAALVRYQVLRDQKQVSGATVVPGPDCRPTGHPPRLFPTLGLTLRWGVEGGRDENPEAAGGWKVLQVAAEGLASFAGVQPGDQIVALNGKLLTAIDGEQRLRGIGASKQPFVLTLHRGGRVKLAAFEPEPQQPL